MEVLEYIDNKTNTYTYGADSKMSVHLSKPIIHTEKVSIGYQQGKNAHVISQNLQLQIRNGEMVCLLGSNGCGKSTLMRSIAGLQPLLNGDVFIENINIKHIKTPQRAHLLSLVLTDRIEAGNLTVADIVAVGRHPHTNSMGTLTEKDHEIINQVLAQCGLAGFLPRLFAQLSDGEKQRVMIARALAQDTPLIMLDEPTAHLDLLNRIEMMKTLRKLAKETHKAILLSTHELDLALQWADTLWLMDTKGFIHQGAPEDLVLNGAFSKIFGSTSFLFDIMSGSFKMRHTQTGKVNLLGKGLQYEWTRRALEREGYELDSSFQSPSTIEIMGEGYWMFNCANHNHLCTSVSELLTWLRHEVYLQKDKA